MDFLSHAWCNFAVQALQPDHHHDQSMALLDNPMIVTKIESKTETKTPFLVSFHSNVGIHVHEIFFFFFNYDKDFVLNCVEVGQGHEDR